MHTRDPWVWRFLAYTKDRNNTDAFLCGLIFRAQRHRLKATDPFLADQATIREDGIVTVPFQRDNGGAPMLLVLGTTEAVREQFNRVADAIQMDDQERLELFDVVKKWVGRDMRARSEA